MVLSPVPVSDVAEVVVGDVVKVVALRYSSYNLHGGTFRSLTLCVSLSVHKHGTGDVYVDMARHDTSQVLPS